MTDDKGIAGSRRPLAIAPWICLLAAILTAPIYSSVLLWTTMALVGAIASALIGNRTWHQRHLPADASKRGRRRLSVLAFTTTAIFALRAALLASLSTIPNYEDYGGLVEPPAMAWIGSSWVAEHGAALWWGSYIVLVVAAAACAVHVYQLQKQTRRTVATEVVKHGV